MEGISIAKLLIIGALIVLLFGTNKLRSLGGDLGSAIKGFKKAMKDDDSAAAKPAATKSEAEEIPAERVTHKE
ncbi:MULTISPECIES: twin-arginine translocase subunit TatE [Tatumella]|uniref:Probable Sec-independent protein translocase protein TatE n=1 Tax=Tatumella punctata TaxID=399969 RepID=A0ABW1VR61_9GAMM|nr:MULTISPECIES: twin-arginine translocase subunit TatE [unclassified Tatumella]MBS0854571.1 twin-arginine translocase subunit TatE [Tatumella sp. JGM16]MBS0875840.1 twin-arginine translocase subunit TatE [Tatumella sp. JGM82]MBS0890245.1 twin-arginine translocase subunit TatE [Tatumella sp. JGM94]MBS0894253.1 twin-arginine translocase subunit TatE [Tatumella sp. JGM130]MBS0900371.1 twin-arginine translocase subunit TatE [Tatumella sp. JGM100]